MTGESSAGTSFFIPGIVLVIIQLGKSQKCEIPLLVYVCAVLTTLETCFLFRMAVGDVIVKKAENFQKNLQAV